MNGDDVKYQYPDSDEVYEVERTLVVIARCDDVVEGSGTAHFVITQPIVEKSSLWETNVDIPY